MATLSQPRARQHVELVPSLGSGVQRVSRLALYVGAVLVLPACADVEPPAPLAEKNPFELSQPEPTPAKRVAQVKIALRSQALPGQEPQPKTTPVEPEPLLAPPMDVAKQAAQVQGQIRANQELEQKGQGQTGADQEPGQSSPLTLKVRGDFAAFRGVQERLVWAFAGVSDPLWTSLQVGDCIGIDSSMQRAPELGTAEAQGTQEIELLDLGRFEIELGDQRFEVPLHLAPGVLPYASGVQYRGEQELAMIGSAQDELALRWDGVAALPGSQLLAPVPPKLNFELSQSDSDQGEEESTWYDMAWAPAKAKSQSRLYLHARLVPKEDTTAPTVTGINQQSQVICRLADRGEWQLDLEELADEGLDLSAEEADIEFELRRVQDFSKSAPGFDRVHVQIERSESLRLRSNADD